VLCGQCADPFAADGEVLALVGSDPFEAEQHRGEPAFRNDRTALPEEFGAGDEIGGSHMRRMTEI